MKTFRLSPEAVTEALRMCRASRIERAADFARRYPGPLGGLLSLEDAEDLARRGLPPTHYAKTDGGDR